MTRIEVRDTRLENAVDTITATADINAPEPLRVAFAYGGAMSAAYMNYEGLLVMMRDICKNWKYVRKLRISVELDNKGEGNV